MEEGRGVRDLSRICRAGLEKNIPYRGPVMREKINRLI
jgi:hypothetical protein